MLKNVFLFTGEDSYSLEAELARWKREFIGKHGELNLSVLDGLSVETGEIWNAVNTLPFLGEKRLVIVRDLPAGTTARESANLENKEEFLTEKVEQVPSETILVFVSPVPDKRRRFAKKLLQNAETKSFPEITGAKLVAWINKEFEKRQMKVNSAISGRLAQMVGADLWQMNQEIDKLCKFADGEDIELTDLEVLVHGQLQDNIFKLTDAMGNRDARKMIECFQNLVNGGESPQQIFYMLVRQVRLLSLARSVIDEKKTEQAAQILKVAPFTIRPLLTQAQKFGWAELRKMYAELLDIDTKLKTSGIEVSTEDTRALELALERFLVGVAGK